MATYGNSFEETIALVTAGTEIFQNKSQQISRGLNTIGARITKNADALKQYNIDVYDTNGELRSTYDILKDLKSKWDDLSSSEKTNLGLTLAGTNQYKVFSAVMSNFGKAIDVVERAQVAEGSAMRENEKYMKSIEAKTNLLKASVNEFVLGNGGLGDAYKKILDITTAIVDFINKIGGLPTILTTIITLVGVLNTKSIIGFITTLTSKLSYLTTQTIPILIENLKGMLSGVESTTIGFEGLAVSASTAQLALGAVIAVIGIAVIAMHNYNESIKETLENGYSVAQQQESLNDEFSKLYSKINNQSTSLSELKEVYSSLGGSQEEVNELLATENGLRDENIRLLRQQMIENAKAYIANKDNQNAYYTALSEKYGVKVKKGENSGTIENMDGFERAMRTTRQDKETDYELLSIIHENTDPNSRKYSREQKQLNELKEELDLYNESISTFEEQTRIANMTVDDFDDSIFKLSEDVENSENAFEDTEVLLGHLADTINDLKFLTDGYGTSLSSISDSYSALCSAIDEYNENQSLSLDTIDKLMALDSDYLMILEEQNGKLEFSANKFWEVVKAKIEDAKETIYSTAVKKLDALETQAHGDATSDDTESIKDNTDALIKNSEAVYENAKAQALASGDSEYVKKAKAIVSETEQAISLLEKLKVSVGGVDKASSKASGSTSKATDEITKKISILKDKISDIKDEYSKQIDAIKKLKDAKTKEIDAQIKALEKEKDARQKYWDDILDNNEKENKERERAIELEEKLEALALAQQKRLYVLKDGKFQYTQDDSAVSNAQQDYADTVADQDAEREREKLEALKDAEMESYDARLSALKDYKEQCQAEYDAQIEMLENQRDALIESYNNEVEIWENRKSQYDSALEAQKNYNNQSLAEARKYVSEYNSIMNGRVDRNAQKAEYYYNQQNIRDNRYASGSDYIGEDQIALVGENPKYKELVIGSKLNNDQGILMNLKRGMGVVNAESTQTLAKLFSNAKGLGGVSQNTTNSNNGTSISINSISLPSVKDGNDFVNYLQNFSTDMTQLAYSR